MNATLVTRCREVIEEQLTDTATILVAGQTRDASGGHRKTFTPGPVYPCRLEDTDYQQEETIEAGRQTAKARWMITLPHYAQVKQRDQIRISNQTFEVVDVSTARTERLSIVIDAAKLV